MIQQIVFNIIKLTNMLNICPLNPPKGDFKKDIFFYKYLLIYILPRPPPGDLVGFF